MAMSAPTGTVRFCPVAGYPPALIEVRDAAEYFEHIQDVKITKDMLDLAKHIVENKAGHFEPAKFQDHYESALQDCW